MRCLVVGAVIVAGCTRTAHPIELARTTVAPRTASTTSASPSASASSIETSSVDEAPDDDAVILSLPIPPRKQAQNAPDEGWCGETAVQEALLHLGAYVPQSIIHRAGKPKHPDLYADEIPVALAALGVQTSTYVAEKGKAGDWTAFSSWIRAALDEGDPVLAGVKIFPTEHPNWGLDHFVLVIGYGNKGLWVNTTWGTRAWVSDSTDPGLSFAHAFYAIRMRRLLRPETTLAARLSVLEENENALNLRVECVDAAEDAPLRIERRRGVWQGKPDWQMEIEGGDVDVSVDASSSSRFRCAQP